MQTEQRSGATGVTANLSKSAPSGSMGVLKLHSVDPGIQAI
jgi:hypothetical protein